MWDSAVIPGILRDEPLTTNAVDTERKEKARFRMTVDNSANRQGADTEAATLLMLYEQYRRPIHSYTYRLLGNREDADDVTQEVFVRACTAWNGLYEREHLSAWLYRIATNLCVDQLRRRKRVSWWPLSRRTRNDEDTQESAGDEMVRLLTDMGGIPDVAERELIQMALAHMPHEYAVVLVLNAAQGVPYQEIATIVGISPNAAATRISRAKKMFAEQYRRLVKGESGKVEKRRS